MSKTELVDNVAKVADITKKVAAVAVSEVFDSMRAALLSGEKVTVVGFGTFSVKDVPTREGRNPATNESITIAAHRKIMFKVGSELKAAVK